MKNVDSDLLDRVRKNMERVWQERAKPEPKERPVRIYKTETGRVLRVDWKCPTCFGKPGWKGCKTCKGLGVIDGITKAIYERLRCEH